MSRGARHHARRVRAVHAGGSSGGSCGRAVQQLAVGAHKLAGHLFMAMAGMRCRCQPARPRAMRSGKGGMPAERHSQTNGPTSQLQNTRARH